MIGLLCWQWVSTNLYKMSWLHSTPTHSHNPFPTLSRRSRLHHLVSAVAGKRSILVPKCLGISWRLSVNSSRSNPQDITEHTRERILDLDLQLNGKYPHLFIYNNLTLEHLSYQRHKWMNIPTFPICHDLIPSLDYTPKTHLIAIWKMFNHELSLNSLVLSADIVGAKTLFYCRHDLHQAVLSPSRLTSTELHLKLKTLQKLDIFHNTSCMEDHWSYQWDIFHSSIQPHKSHSGTSPHNFLAFCFRCMSQIYTKSLNVTTTKIIKYNLQFKKDKLG